jgi:hypothetical protein
VVGLAQQPDEPHRFSRTRRRRASPRGGLGGTLARFILRIFNEFGRAEILQRELHGLTSAANYCICTVTLSSAVVSYLIEKTIIGIRLI